MNEHIRSNSTFEVTFKYANVQNRQTLFNLLYVSLSTLGFIFKIK